MRTPLWIDVGASTHTGKVRATNEDDYVLLSLTDGDGDGDDEDSDDDADGRVEQAGSRPGSTAGQARFLGAIADGMGGLVGGGEASRLAVRALARRLVDPGDPDGDPSAELRYERDLRDGFAAAAARVAERAASSPRLREMGTTLTAVLLDARGEGSLAHVGDTRCYLVQGAGGGGQPSQLTVDHAVEGAAHHLLTRCIGAGADHIEPDVRVLKLRPGDSLVLATDGVWNAMPATALAAVVSGAASAQAAADAIVEEAVRSHGGDNATVVVLVYAPDDARGEDSRGLSGSSVERFIPREERALGLDAPLPRHALVAPVWPWFVWVAAGVLVTLAWLRVFHGFELPGFG